MLSLTSSPLSFSAPVAASSSTNPFEGKTFYVNPSYKQELDTSIASASGAAKKTMKSMREVPSAYWIDKKDKIRGNTTESLEGILKDAASYSPAHLVVVIHYDLPNRDCDAKASNGEICCYANADGTCDYSKSGDCAEGLKDYETNYVDEFAKVLKEYQDRVPIVAIVEPDSLPNLATNTGNPHCGNSATTAAYKSGIKYAIETLAAQAPKVDLYLDAAHGGWLGWADNAEKFATSVGEMGVASKLRGFTSNVANYQGLGTPCNASAFSTQLPLYCKGDGKDDACCADPCGLLSQWNSGNNEYNYVQMMTAQMEKSIAGFSPKWLIDTGRNGVDDMRDDCANWCNARGAGVGLLPTTDTKLPTMVDALYWLKTPGESDGCTEELPSGDDCPRYDSMCGSADSIGSQSAEPRCPEAGAWFDYQIKQLATNAHMSGPPASPPSPSPVSPVTPSPVTPTPAPAPTPSPAGTCANKAYAACGNGGAAGCCPAGYACTAQNQYYSQCVPTAQTLAAAAHNGLWATRHAHGTARGIEEARKAQLLAAAAKK